MENDKKKMSVAEILAAARKSKANETAVSHVPAPPITPQPYEEYCYVGPDIPIHYESEMLQQMKETNRLLKELIATLRNETN